MSLRVLTIVTVALVVCTAAAAAGLAAEPAARYVVQISVDGLGSSYLQALIDQGQLPAFKRMQTEGSWTNNARTDFDFTITLPNHTCMVTGRPVKDRAANPAAITGHNWLVNTDPGEKTLHSVRNDYVSSTFDVAHDHGLRTGVFVSKSKFKVYDQSYDERHGAPDTTGDDNGRDKVDLYVKDGNSAALTERLVSEMRAKPFHYTFVHFHDTDSAGHSKKWGSPDYNAALIAVDGYLAKIFELLDSEPFQGKSAIIISADHGGTGLDHFFNTNPINFTIPFYTWGAGVAQGKNLYSLNSASRTDPQTARPDYPVAAPGQPIRNGDGGNLALSLLGLPAIPGSTINAAQDLHTR